MTILRTISKLIIALLVLLCLFESTTSSKVELETASSIRLPTAIHPTKYHLHITSRIHENISAIRGNVVIDFVVAETTNEIVLHAKHLGNFTVSLIELRNDRRFDDLKYSLQKEKDFLKISAPKKLQIAERYSLEIFYTGTIQDEFYGIYKSSYLDENNRTIPLAVTQFEPTYARLAFPCFDEPSFKAKFVISITHGYRYAALSNMPIESQTRWTGDMIITTFRETPKIPTYLIAFLICDYSYISEIVNGIEHRVFFPPNAKDIGGRALANAIQSVGLLEKHFGIEYPLPKLDHIHVKDTVMNAMEHWGLIVYDDVEFLTTLEDRDSTVKRIVLQNSCIFHQWLGSMVTLKWWSWAWLKSGLGTYYSYKMVDMVYPTWKIEVYFILTEEDEMYKTPITKPLVRQVETNEDIDDITADNSLFQMGACIIKMFNHAIGNETFTKGLVSFLKEFKYSVADENDFFEALQSAIRDDYVYIFQNGQSLRNIMRTWTHNQGFPTVKITRNYNNGTITIHQRSNSDKVDEKWWIPLNFATETNTNFGRTKADFIMPPQAEITIDPEDINVSLMNGDWLIVNKQQTGLYYVIYDDTNLELIAEALNKDHTKIHMLNRALLFRDLKAIIDTELGAVEPVLDSLKYLKYEQNSLPWFRASELIKELWSRLEGGKAFEPFRTFVHDIIGNFYHQLFELPLYKLSFADSIIKKHIYKLACDVELSECLAYARHQTKEYLYYNWPIEESLRQFTMCKTMQSADSEELQEILEKMLYPSVKSFKQSQFIMALRCVRSEENLKIIFDFVSEGSKNYLKRFISDYIYENNPLYRKIVLQSVKDLTKTIKEASEKLREKRETEPKSEETTQKQEEFKRKFEDRIYAWLKSYEREQQATVGISASQTNLYTDYKGLK